MSIAKASKPTFDLDVAPTLAGPVSSRLEIPSDRLYRISVDQYIRMSDFGILARQERTELIEGVIVNMSPQGPEHSFYLQHVALLLSPLIPTGWHLRSQMPLQTSSSEPEPDIAIVRGSHLDYRAGYPLISHAALVVEIADTSLHYDRTAKAILYSNGGAGEYWLLNFGGQTLEVYNSLRGPAPLQPMVLRAGSVVPFVINGQQLATIAVSDLLALHAT